MNQLGILGDTINIQLARFILNVDPTGVLILWVLYCHKDFKSGNPTQKQIKFWDSFVVQLSKFF